MPLEWMIPFSAEQQHQKVAHLIDMSVWVSRRVCTPWVVNSRIAVVPGTGVRCCSMCSILAQVGSRRRPEIPAQVATCSASAVSDIKSQMESKYYDVSSGAQVEQVSGEVGSEIAA